MLLQLQVVIPKVLHTKLNGIMNLAGLKLSISILIMYTAVSLSPDVVINDQTFLLCVGPLDKGVGAYHTNGQKEYPGASLGGALTQKTTVLLTS